MAIVFPASPSVNETFTAGSITYKWDGEKWIGLGVTPADRLIEGSNSLEIDANNDLKWIGDQVVVGDFAPVDDRNGGGIHIRHSNGISFKSNSGQSVSRNWRIRGDDWGWGNLDFGVGDSVSDWSDSIADNVLSLTSSRRVGIKQSTPNSILSIGTGNAVGDATNPAIQIGDGGSGTYRLGFYTTSEGGIIDAANGDDGLIIHTKVVGESLRVNANGELLIGEDASPTDAGITDATRCRLGMSFGNATGTYIEIGGTSRAADGLSKLAVMRHGYWGGQREVGSLGFLTSSSSGGAGRGFASFVVHTGTSGNGDGGLSTDSPSLERFRVNHYGQYFFNTTLATNWGAGTDAQNTDNQSTYAGNMCFRSDTGALVLSNNADSGYSAVYINKWNWNTGDDNRWINFYLNATAQDSITWNGSNIVYGTNSDYRIKTNVRDFTGGIDALKELRVRKFDYIDTQRGTDHVGFIAHELQEVVPEAVTGEKDGMRIEEETGNEVMNIQSVDYGKLTPLLAAALQEALAEIETLKGRLDAAGL